VLTAEFVLSLRGELSNVEIVKTMEILQDGLNTIGRNNHRKTDRNSYVLEKE
jgi:hypothetical protein